MTLDEPEAIAEVLENGLLRGRTVSAVPLVGDHGVVLIVECAPDEVLAAWKAARVVVDKTGRWPVVVADGADDGQGAGTFSRFAYDHGGGDQSPAAICTRALAVDPHAATEELRAAKDSLRWGEWSDVVQMELDETARRYGTAPSMSDVALALGENPGPLTLDRWLFDWEQAAEANGAQPSAPITWHQDWYVPEGSACGVALLPTIHGWETPAWVSFFGAEGPGGHERLIAVLRHWHQQWRAEVVANWGTMLELVIERPPTTAAAAYPVAVEHELLAGSTLAGPGVSVREHASALVNRGTWFLHDRP